jgi:hypothetical protein
MPKITIALGVILIGLGAGAYFATGRSSVTALIPAFAGVPFVLLGVWAMKPPWRKLAMHIAALLGVLGFAGTVSGLMKLPALLRGDDLPRPAAVGIQSAMAILCLVYVVLCIMSFIKARRGASAKA